MEAERINQIASRLNDLQAEQIDPAERAETVKQMQQIVYEQAPYIITVYYDSGFIIGLKGFVAAIVGGLASYPLTAIGAVMVGILEAFSSFWASGYKEVIVFTLIIPVLIWLSLTAVHHEEEEQ